MDQPRATLAAGMQVTPSVRLLSPLGAGGMGAVWLAEHTALNTRVVVKFMLGGGLDSSTGARARFKREAEAASQVKSPHVVQTFDYGVTTEGVPFIVMEHLEGRDLGAELTAKGALDPVTVITIVTQVAKALTKAHAAGLLHRDIKPDNIFLCQSAAEDDLFVKLLDFGIAKAHAPEGGEGDAELDGQTKTGQVVGTPFYMSPEQVTAQKVIDSRSDLWSLGIVAFEALTGKRPYDGPSFGALAVKIATGEPPRPCAENPDLPRSVDVWFARACARDPAARFGSARELADGLRAAFEGVVSLPPVVSGAMSDSGPRASVSSGSGVAVVPSIPAGPISVDDDAHARPSFVLASTVQPDEAGGDRSALARSEPSAIARGAEDSRARRGPPPVLKIVLPLVALGALTLAIAAGWTAKGRSTDDASKGLPGPSAQSGPSGSTTAPAGTGTEPVASATLSASALASVSVPITAPALDDGGAHAPTAATSTAPLISPRASAASHGTSAARPGASSVAATSARPTGSETAPRSSARPNPTSHDDPLF